MSDRYTRNFISKGLQATLYLRPFSQLFSALAFVVLVRFLSEEEFGVYSLFLSSLAVIGLIFSLGIANTIQRFVPEYGKLQHYTRLKRVIHGGMLIRLASTLIIISLSYIFQSSIVELFNIQAHTALILPLALIVLSHFQARILLVALPGLMLQTATLLSQVFFALFKILGYLTFAHFELPFEAVLWIDLGAYLIMLLVLTWSYVKSVLPLTGGPSQLGTAERRRVQRYAMFYNFNDIGLMALGRDVDNLFLGALVNPFAVGAYSFATKLTDILMRLNPVAYFYTVIQPVFFTLDPAVDQKKINTIFSILLKLGYLIVIPILVGTTLALESIIHLVFAGRFEGYTLMIVTVLGFSAFATMGRPIGLVAQLCERADIVLYSKVFSGLNLLLNVVLAPIYGVWGIVFATGFSILMKDLFVWWFVREFANPKQLVWFALYSILMWGSFVLLASAISLYVTSHVAYLVVLICIGPLWAIVYLRFAFRNAQEIEILQQAVHGRVKIAKLLGIAP